MVFLGLCAARNLPWRLSDYDQAKQAFVSLEMSAGGDRWFQHTPGFRRLATKPPLVGWLSAGLHRAGMPWEAAWRLPSLLAAAAVAVLLWRAGGALWPAAQVGRLVPEPPRGCGLLTPAGGGSGTSRPTWNALSGPGCWLAVGAFGLNLLTPRLATLARTDMPLTLWTTAAGLLVWHRRRGDVNRAWTAGERWGLFAVVTAAMLTKGPTIYAFLVPGLVGLAVWERFARGDTGVRFVGRPSRLPGSACGNRDGRPTKPCPDGDLCQNSAAGALPPGKVPLWPWLLPFAVFALWVAVGCGSVPGFYEQVVGREFLGRFDYSERAVHIRQPLWFYVACLLARMAPWSLLLLATVFLTRSAWRAVAREPAGRWLIAWAAGGLLVMSLVPSKRVDRIFPVVPPLCLLLTAVVGRAREETAESPAAGRRRWPRVETLAGWTTAAALAVAVAATGYEVHKGFLRHEDALDRFGRGVRRLATSRGWRPPELAVGARVDESDDTMLVCLRRQRWLDTAATLAAWRAGRVDALVLQANTLDDLRSALGTEGADYAVETRLTATRAGDAPYVLLVRPPPPPATAASRPFPAPGPNIPR